MTNYHKRWLCKECKREWHDVHQTNAMGGNYVNSAPVTITGNPPGDNCPVCGSPEIIEVAYKPRFPGLDIPRNGEFIELPRRKTLAIIPGMVSTQDVKIESSQEVIGLPKQPIEPEIKQPPLTLVKPEIPMPVVNEISDNPIYDLSDMD